MRAINKFIRWTGCKHLAPSPESPFRKQHAHAHYCPDNLQSNLDNPFTSLGLINSATRFPALQQWCIFSQWRIQPSAQGRPSQFCIIIRRRTTPNFYRILALPHYASVCFYRVLGFELIALAEPSGQSYSIPTL